MKNFYYKIYQSIFFLFVFLTFSGLAQAQVNVEQATRETDLQSRRDDLIRKALDAAGTAQQQPTVTVEDQPSPQKDEPRILVKTIDLRGNQSLPASAFADLLKTYEGRELSIGDLRGLAKKIEKEYLKKGIIAAAFLPPQKSEDNSVIIEVVESKMGELLVQGHRYFRKERLPYYWKIKSGDVIHYPKLTRSLQSMNKNPDREVKATLKAGQEPGTTDVVLTPETNFPIHVFASYDNDGAISTGKSRTGIGVRHNNLLGRDDIFLLGQTSGRDFYSRYVYHNIPVNAWGTSLLYGVSHSRSIPTKEFAPYDIRSKSDDASVSLHQDLFTDKGALGEAWVGFAAKDKTTTMTTGTYSRDRLRILDAGTSLTFKGTRSATTVSPVISQGIPAFGASTRNNPLASRSASSTFTKLNVSVSHKRILTPSIQANLKVRTQLASTKLTPQTEFSIGGIDSVRGYPGGDYMADNAAVVNSELVFPVPFVPEGWRLPHDRRTVREELSLFTFADYGWGMRRGPSATDKKSVSDLGVGAGIRLSVYDQFSVDIGWGIPVGNDPISRSGDSFFFISVDFMDQIPAMMKRIKQANEAAAQKTP